MKRKMIQLAESNGWVVSVYAMEDDVCLIKKTTEYDKVVDDMESVDAAVVVFYDYSGRCLGSVLVVNGLAEDEEISDYSYTPDIINMMKELFAGTPDQDLF